jgi:AraC family transcriptional activator of pyochelin receptor
MPESSPKTRKPLTTAWDCLKMWDQVFPAGGQHLMLPSSIELMFVNFTNLCPMQLECSFTTAPLVFSFWLAGTGRGHFRHALCKPRTLTVSAGKACVSYTPGGMFQSEMPGRQHYRNFSIYLTPDSLQRFFGNEQDLAPRELRAALDGDGRRPFLLMTEMTASTRVILDQITTCPYHGVYRRLFLENKCLELIIRQFYDISRKNDAKPAAKLPVNDIERIHEAKRILTNSMDNPPSLHQLGRQVGINANKLSRGFRQVFGTTVHNLLRQERLNRARLLLEENRLSITEISHQLGYSDASHFVREFSRQYGTTPGRFARALRN